MVVQHQRAAAAAQVDPAQCEPRLEIGPAGRAHHVGCEEVLKPCHPPLAGQHRGARRLQPHHLAAKHPAHHVFESLVALECQRTEGRDKIGGKR